VREPTPMLRQLRILLLTAVPAALMLGMGPAPRAQAAVRYPVPAAITRDCSVDVTKPLLSWIASVPDHSILSFTAGACYRIDGTLELRGRNGLDFEGNGATFRAATTGDPWRSQWRAVGGSQLVFRDMHLRGGSPLGGTHVSYLQHQHAFDLLGVVGVELDRIEAANLYGDCVYVGQGWDSKKSWSRNVHVHDSACSRNGRMGVAVTAGRDVLVERTSFSHIALSVFDIEPNGIGFGARNITFANNHVGSAYDYVFVATGDGPVDGVTVSGNRIAGKGMRMGVFSPPGQRRSNITITGNVSDTGYSDAIGAAMAFAGVDGLSVTRNRAPLSGRDMALASASRSCDVEIAGNAFPGGVTESRVAPYECHPSHRADRQAVKRSHRHAPHGARRPGEEQYRHGTAHRRRGQGRRERAEHQHDVEGRACRRGRPHGRGVCARGRRRHRRQQRHRVPRRAQRSCRPAPSAVHCS
jgi:hypothetical protein